MVAVDHYAALGIARDAAPEAVRAAYRALAKKYHPDSSSDKTREALVRFRQINEAHAILSDQSKRAKYDESLDPASFERREKPARPHSNRGQSEKVCSSTTTEREPLEKIRNGVVVIGWSLMAGFLALLAVAIIGGTIVGVLNH
jgi:DnaJ-class molecular chaperone